MSLRFAQTLFAWLVFKYVTSFFHFSLLFGSDFLGLHKVAYFIPYVRLCLLLVLFTTLAFSMCWFHSITFMLYGRVIFNYNLCTYPFSIESFQWHKFFGGINGVVIFLDRKENYGLKKFFFIWALSMGWYILCVMLLILVYDDAFSSFNDV